MIKAIIFDIGGVLIRTEDYSSRHSWEDKLGLARGESEAIVFNSEMGLKAQRGEITNEQFWRWIGERLSLSTERLKAFHEGFWAGDKLDVNLVNMIYQLKKRYQTAVISNATTALKETLSKKYSISDAFDLIVGSAEEKVMKPDHKIYLRTLELLGRKPEETVFIDDFSNNVNAAQEIGMHAIQFKPPLDVAAELAKLGVT